MIKGSFILIISLALLSPLPFVSPWYESAHAQVNKSTTGPPALVQNQTSTKPLESFMAYGKNFTKIPDIGRANTTATNLAHDMLMDVRHEYVELNRTSHQLNKTLVDLTASVLNKARTGQNFGIFGSLAVQTGHDARTIEMLQNSTAEYVQVREALFNTESNITRVLFSWCEVRFNSTYSCRTSISISCARFVAVVFALPISGILVKFFPYAINDSNGFVLV